MGKEHSPLAGARLFVDAVCLLEKLNASHNSIVAVVSVAERRIQK
jgi:hypothetical protein